MDVIKAFSIKHNRWVDSSLAFWARQPLAFLYYAAILSGFIIAGDSLIFCDVWPGFIHVAAHTPLSNWGFMGWSVTFTLLKLFVQIFCFTIVLLFAYSAFLKRQVRPISIT